jgi:hypothetical protein
MENLVSFVVGMIIVLLLISITPLIVMFLWNALLPSILGLPVINFWQAFGISVLCGILFGGVSK